jgi:hypothetical protein
VQTKIAYKMSSATRVLTTVTTTLSKVVVEQPQPRVLVRNSKRSWLAGHTSALKTGSKRLVAGTHVAL